MAKVTRRTFLKLAGATAAAAALQPGMKLFGVPALAQEARPFNIGINAEVLTLDPHHAPAAIIGARIYGQIFDSLTRTDTSGQVLPMLATEWAQADDTTWVFTLRDDVVFHDGTPMTVRDVAYSLNRLLFSENESIIRPTFAPYFASVEATGDTEITITTPQVDPLIPLRLASFYACIMPEAYTESAGFDTVQTAPIGTGPYKVRELVAGERLVLERHSEYWGGEPPASEVTFRLIPENATRLAALQAGEVDLITTVPPDLTAQITDNGLRVDQVLLYNFMLTYFNTKTGVTANPDIRKALSLAIDRDIIAQELWSGTVRAMNDYYFPTEFPYDAARSFPYNPEEAMRLLEQAGYAGEVLEFTPPSTYYTNGQLVTDVINELWSAIGVNVEYSPLETPQWAERSLGGQNIATLQSFGTGGDPALNGSITAWASWMGNYYTPDEEFNALAAEAGASSDLDLRRTNYRAIADILDRDTPIAPLYQSVEFYGVRDGVQWTPHQEFYINLRPGEFSF
ncbi:MAG: ABC transporter substrate-binding protein [bacterium]|nr:ABC transporter substrate-binding protein [bacterium]